MPPLKQGQALLAWKWHHFISFRFAKRTRFFGLKPLDGGRVFQGGFDGMFDSLYLFMCLHLLCISERLFNEEL